MIISVFRDELQKTPKYPTSSAIVIVESLAYVCYRPMTVIRDIPPDDRNLGFLFLFAWHAGSNIKYSQIPSPRLCLESAPSPNQTALNVTMPHRLHFQILKYDCGAPAYRLNWVTLVASPTCLP